MASILLGLLAVSLAAEPALQLVESVPMETSLDDPAIPNTPEVWPALIRSAKHTLDIEQFYIAVEGDSLMESIIFEVEAAAARGVRVRVIADARFADIYPEALNRIEQAKGAEVRQLDLRKRTGGVQHAKFFVVDGQTAFLGSQNWDWRALRHVLELGVVVRVPEVVRALQFTFEQDWALTKGLPSPPPVPSFDVTEVAYGEGMVRVHPVASPKELLPAEGMWDLPELLRLLASAKKSVRVQLLSHTAIGYDRSEWRELDDALRAAADRGVAVQVLLADWSKAEGKVETVQALAAHPGVQVRFVTIPKASTGYIPFARVIHSKFLVIDGTRSWLGTNNWSKDYFYSSRNVGIVVEGAPFAADLDRRFLLTWDSPYCEPVDPEATYRAPKHK